MPPQQEQQQEQPQQPIEASMEETTCLGGGNPLQDSSMAVGQPPSAARVHDISSQQQADTSLRELVGAHPSSGNPPVQRVAPAAEATRDSGQPVLDEAPKQGAAEEAADPLLAEVDIQEQARILKEIELRKVLGSGGSKAGQAQRGGGGRGQPCSRPGDKKQQGIASFFNRGR